MQPVAGSDTGAGDLARLPAGLRIVVTADLAGRV